jgi:hypothetical protein
MPQIGNIHLARVRALVVVATGTSGLPGAAKETQHEPFNTIGLSRCEMEHRRFRRVSSEGGGAIRHRLRVSGHEIALLKFSFSTLR